MTEQDGGSEGERVGGMKEGRTEERKEKKEKVG